MNALLSPSRLRLWAARLFAGLGAALAAGPSLAAIADGDATHFYALRLIGDVAALVLAGRRRFRFAAALWFGCGAFFHLVMTADSGRSPLANVYAPVPMAIAAALLLWPLLSARAEDDRLAPLSGAWALVATLLVTAVDAALIRSTDALPRDAAFVVGASALALFAGSMIASHLGVLRWVGQLGVALLLGLAHTSELRLGASPAQTVGELVVWSGLVSFALGLDWLRAGPTSRSRFLRAGGLSLAVSVLPLAAVALWAPLGPTAFAMALARAAALGLAAAIMPRVAGKPAGLFTRPPVAGRPPVALMATAIGFAVFGVLVAKHQEESAFAVGAALVPAFICMALRTRFTRAALFLMAGVPMLVAAFATARHDEGSLVTLGALGALWTLGAAITGPKSGRHFHRRFRWASAPAPRVSLSLAGAAAALLAAWGGASTLMTPDARAGLLAAAGGALPLPMPLYFHPAELRDPPEPARHTGGPVVVDPLGRGTWVVDEERDEVALVGLDQRARRFSVGDWPELLVVTAEGRVFVSCREAARIDVIEPDFQRRAIELDDEVRGLALDRAEQRLYAGLLTTRTLAAFDAATLEPLGRAALDADPRSVAVTAQGIATLPDKGAAVELISADLRRHWTAPLPGGQEGGQAWHGQALLPAGRDLLVLHAQVNTGLERPVPRGGYGGGVSEPINLVATVLQDGRAPLAPANVRRVLGALDVPDVSGAALGAGAVYVASRIQGQVVRVPLDGGAPRSRFFRSDAPDVNPGHEVVAHGQGVTGVALDGDRVETFAAFDRVLVAAESNGHQGEARLGAGRLDAQLALGRQLFFRNDRQVSQDRLACASCHVDGREDGLVWRLQGARLQTPSLTGRLSDTAPYNWHGTTASLEDNIAQTITRLGGDGLEDKERRALARYLREGLRPARRAPVQDAPAAVAHGRALFNDRVVGCASCHDPDAAFTDGQTHDVESLSTRERDELKSAAELAAAEDVEKEPRKVSRPKPSLSGAFDTPTLRQVGLTAPYFHDGSARSLEELVDNNHDRMGKTSHLSADERRALVAYLRTL